MFLGAFWGEFFLKYESGEKDVTIEPRHTFVFGNSCRKIITKSEGIGAYRN